VLAAALCLVGVGPAAGEALPILTDGYFDDWTVGPVHTDTEGDNGPSGIDFGDIWVAEDDDFLFIRFEMTDELLLQDNNDVALYIDTDSNAGTGVQVENIGAELRWQFGLRTGKFYGNPPPVTISWEDIRMRVLPSWSSVGFEIAIGRDAEPDGSTPLFTGDDIRILIRDEDGDGDIVPNSGGFLNYTFVNESLPPEEPNSMEKESPDHVRLMTYNVLQDSPWSEQSRYDRILSAIEPEIINFQEIYDHNLAQILALVESMLPSGAGEDWFGWMVNDCATISRYPVNGVWTLDGNAAVLLDTEALLNRQLLIINAHLPCCGNNEGRQEEADRIMEFLRDAITVGGTVDVPSGTGVVITGDLNLVGDGQQIATLLTGDIADEGTYGPDFDPDWDGTALTDTPAGQTELRMSYTWRNDGSTYLPGRIDLIITSDSVLGIGNHFTLYTPNMSPAELAAAGLLANDTSEASDHIPVVADLADAVVDHVADDVASLHPALHVSPNPMQGRLVVNLSIERATSMRVDVFDVTGRRVRRIADGAIGYGATGHTRVVWDGMTDAGIPAAGGVYFVRAEGDADGVPFSASTRITRLD